MKKRKHFLTSILLVSTCWSVRLSAVPVDEYWRTDGTSGTWTSTGWNIGSATSTGGTGWTASNNAIFSANSTLTYVTATLFGNVTVTNGSTVTISQAGTASAAAHTYDIGTGSTLTWASQNYTATGTSFIKNGAGTWNIGAIGNAYTGGFTLNAGTIIVSGNNSLGGATSPLTINGGNIQSSGTRSYAPTAITVGGDFIFSGTGNATFGGTVALGSATRTITNSQTSGSLILSGAISSSATNAIVAAGTGVTILSGTNNYTGTTSVTGGTLQFSKPAALYNSTSASWTAANLSVSSGASLAFNVGGASDFTTGNISTILTNLSSVSNNGLMAGSTVALDTTNAASAVTISSAITDSTGTGGGSVGFTKLGAGTLSLTAGNSYTGATTVYNGTLSLGSGGSITSSSNVTVNSTTASATALLDLNGNSNAIGSLTLGGGTTTSTSNVSTGAGTLTLGGDVTYLATNNPLGSTISGNLALGASRNFVVGNSTTAANDLTVSAVVSGSGFSIAKSGTGTLVLSGNNSYSGGTTISGGTLAVGHNNALGSGSAAVSSGATLSVPTGFTLANNIAVASGGTLAGAGTSAFSGTISGAGTLTGPITMNSGGSVSPGTSGAGSLSVATAASLTFSSGSTFAWNLGSLVANGSGTAGTNWNSLTLLGTAGLTTGSVNLIPNFLTANSAPNAGSPDVFWNTAHSWTVVTGSGTSTISGTFLVDNSSFSNGTFNTALSGNDLLLNWSPSAIPEPSTYAAILGGLALTGAAWKRRRSRAAAGAKSTI